MYINVKKKTGFLAPQGIVVIYNTKDANFPFYQFDFSHRFNPKERRFNLPRGLYYTDSAIKVLPKPLKYTLPQGLPKPEIKRPKPFNFKVTFGRNPNKATIDFKKHHIHIDESMLNKPLYCLEYIIGHEFGHYLYKSEKYADLYSQVRMLKMGYNKSQISEAVKMTLTKSYSDYRKDYIDSQLVKTFSHE